jgi:hypothetical protein
LKIRPIFGKEIAKLIKFKVEKTKKIPKRPQFFWSKKENNCPNKHHLLTPDICIINLIGVTYV